MDEAIVALAERQHGKVARRQLLALGLGRAAIDYRVQAGDLRLDRRGVYALGHAPRSRESRWMAAVLYAGEGAVLSFWSAATLWRMRPGTGPRTHVTSPRKRRKAQAITFHHAHLPADEVAVHEGIPVTTPARTLLDLGPLLPGPTLGRMIDAAPWCEGAPLAVLLERYPRKPGGPVLRGLLGGERPFTRSDLEARVLALIDEAGLPLPYVNVVVEGQECDLVWWEERVIAEVDSYVTHGTRTAFERDRARDRNLAAAGWRVVRLTDDRPEAGVADLSRLLAASAARSPARRGRAA